MGHTLTQSDLDMCQVSVDTHGLLAPAWSPPAQATGQALLGRADAMSCQSQRGARQGLYEPRIEISYSSIKRQFNSSMPRDGKLPFTVPSLEAGGNATSRAGSVTAFLIANWKPILQALTMFYVMCACTVLIFLVGDSPLSIFGRREVEGAWIIIPQRHSLAETGASSVSVASLAPHLKAPPAGFDWEAYLKFNPELRQQGIDNRVAAEQHYLTTGHLEKRLHKPANMTLRYTACGGLFNQHYCHLSALALAVEAGFDEAIWPPMQERASFAKRYSTDARDNVQTWQYVDAETLWDMPTIRDNFKDKFNITVTRHPANCPMPDFNQPTTAYQLCSLEGAYDLHVKFEGDMYIKHLDPETLRDMVYKTIHDGVLRAEVTTHPANILVDFPCTLFMMEFRKTPWIEDVANSLAWAPSMQTLADKVASGIRRQSNGRQFNGIHLRMEKDAADWAANTGGMEHYWQEYKDVMLRAKFDVDPKMLYVASGLLKSAQGPDPDLESKAEMERLSKEIVDLKYATFVVYKEMYLTEEELAPVLNEQSALIDFLVLRQAYSVVGVGMSTFSFYLKEDRLMDGRDPRDMSLLTMPSIGTDELFFSAAVVAVRTREKLDKQGRLNEVCQRATLEPCFS